MLANRILLLMLSAFVSAAAMATEPLNPVPFHQVKMTDDFWRPKVERLAATTLPHALRNVQGAVDRLRITAEYLENGGGRKPSPHRFVSSDLFKVMEGAALMIKAAPNTEIEKKMDEIIEIIGRAQGKDGYLYASHQTGSIGGMMGDRAYSHVVHSHELYNMGHMYEAAVAYYRATGKDSFLEIAEKSAKHVNKVFFEGDPNYNDGKPVNQAPGHEEIELALVKLYRVTGNKLYLDMSKKFLDIRGVTYTPHGSGVMSPTYAQQHRPVAQQEKAVGHAVRAGYLYAAMAEVDSELGDQSYTEALNKIWHDIVDTKMHITGGLGAVHGIEGFGPAYVLPNEHAYNETCAAVANVFFNYRMFLKYHDAKYVDVAEVSLMNNSLSGVSQDGTSFFYPNPLEVKRKHKQRSGWFGCACCPSNIARLIPQVSGYMYAHTDDEIFCTFYGSSETTIALEEGKVDLVQQSGYPFDGLVRLTVNPGEKQKFTLKLRIPTWAGRQLVPGKLYSYTRPSDAWTLSLNGKKIDPVIEKGFASVNRSWHKGDRIELRLPMEVKVNTCIEQVKANIGRVAITRGPLVYCAEEVDNSGMVQRFFLEPDAIAGMAKCRTIEDGMLKGITAVEIPARERTLEGSDEASMVMVPYHAWANRGRGSMNVWFGTSRDLAEPDYADRKNRKFDSVTASHTNSGDTVDAIWMKHAPASSADDSISRWTSWPQKGKQQWVEIDLGKEQQITRCGVYWYDDGGGVQVPGAWRLEARRATDDEWKKVEIYNTDSYSTLKDNYNSVQPAAKLDARYVRIVMTPQHQDTTVGILSVNIE